MFRFAPYILKTLWRHRMRTFLTMSGAAVALFVYSMVGTVQQGLDNLKSLGDKTLVVFQANKFCPATSLLQQDYEQKISQMHGVRDVLPLLVFTNNCRASLDVIVFYGVPVDRLKRFRKFTMLEGSWQEFERNQDSAIIGYGVARRRGLRAGEKFSIGGLTVKVAGIYSAADNVEENYIYTHLKFLQRREGKNREGTVTQFEVLLDDSANPKTLCTAIDDTFRGGPLATDTRTLGAFRQSCLADLFELVAIAHYLGYACVGLMIVLVATTSLMSVQDRIREHAILQTIGFAPWQIFGIVMLESLLVSLAGGVLGIGAALLLLTWSPLSIGAEAVAVTFTPSLSLAAMGVAVTVVLGAVAGVVPAWQAARTNIVTALRHV